jgi:hypothetical protein
LRKKASWCSPDRQASAKAICAEWKEDVMSDVGDMQNMLSEIALLLKSGTKADKRQAADKLQRLATIASTLGFTVRPKL